MEIDATLISLLGTIVAIIVSVVTVTISVNKAKSDIASSATGDGKTVTDAMNNALEAARAYYNMNKDCMADKENMKLEHKRELECINEEHMVEINTLREDLRVAVDRINAIESDVHEYQSYIRELLAGIQQLVGQLQANRIPPVWTPSDPPFMSKK